MNVSPLLLDAMNRVPPNKGRRLLPEELEFYGLTEVDPVFEDERNAANAAKLGLDVPQYLRRLKQYDECLERGPFEQAAYDVCWDQLNRKENR